MSSSKWLLLGVVASLGFAAVAAGPAGAKAPPPPPPPAPKIVSIEPGGGFLRAISSDGTIYQLGRLYPAPSCGETLTSSVVLGHLFATPPPSPIAATDDTGDVLKVVLESGDLWIFNESCCTPCYLTGTYMGNVFTLAGAGPSAPASEISPQDSAPATSAIRNAVGSASPNPARSSVSIAYSTAKSGRILVRVFNASGRLVRTLQGSPERPGSHSVSWDGRDDQGSQAASGAYFYQVQYPDGSVGSKSVVLMR